MEYTKTFFPVTSLVLPSPIPPAPRKQNNDRPSIQQLWRKLRRKKLRRKKNRKRQCNPGVSLWTLITQTCTADMLWMGFAKLQGSASQTPTLQTREDECQASRNNNSEQENITEQSWKCRGEGLEQQATHQSVRWDGGRGRDLDPPCQNRSLSWQGSKLCGGR